MRLDSPYRSISRRLAIGIALAVAAITACVIGTVARAQTPTLLPVVSVERIEIPPRSFPYRFKLEREAIAVFGINAPIARLAAQIHQESRWRTNVRSGVGAEGLVQVMPATAAWLPKVCPTLGPPDALDADWSLRALVCYDYWLHDRVSGAADECARWAFTLSAYNGGESNVRRDRRIAASAGADSAHWFGHTEQHSARGARARAENRGYVRRILLVVEPVYSAAGWPGAAACTSVASI